MREIEFRGKCVTGSKYAGQWVYGGYVESEERENKSEGLIVNYFGGGVTSTCHVLTDTVGQFTGCKDKNGKKIYEGDILRSDLYPYHDDGEDNYLGIVFFDDTEKKWQIMKFVTVNCDRAGISNFLNTGFDEYEGELNQFEVIGNIYDTHGLFRNSDEAIIGWFKS
jgi:uncharacterized phage protein (TIGR01671 family)